MTYFEGALLGLIQGLTEFLPVSSSAHLSLLQSFFGIDSEKVLPFAVLLHLGTLVSVFLVYFKDIGELLVELARTVRDLFTGKGLRLDSSPVRRLGAMIIVASVPTAIIGLVFHDFFESLYVSPGLIAAGLIFTGFLLFVTEKYSVKVKLSHKEEGIKATHALLVGVFQGIAIWPGISRSGATLAGGLVTGLDRNTAIKYAFLISIPAILGSAIFEAKDAFTGGFESSWAGPAVIGVLIACISGLFAIKVMLRVVRNKSLFKFSIYVWILAAFVLIYINI